MRGVSEKSTPKCVFMIISFQKSLRGMKLVDYSQTAGFIVLFLSVPINKVIVANIIDTSCILR
jgi:hypothetical protein